MAPTGPACGPSAVSSSGTVETMLPSERTARSRSALTGLRLWVAGAVLATAVTAVAASNGGAVDAVGPEPDSFEVSGTGNGHGRGLSQWGAYGRAVNGGQSWQTILDAYYGGTSSGQTSNSTIDVRLLRLDGLTTVGVVSSQRSITWAATSQSSSATYRSVYAAEVQPNVFDVFGLTDAMACPGGQSFAFPDGTFSIGSPVSDAVRTIQRFLNAYGFNAGSVDGAFGPLTEGAVKRFQQSSGLVQSGVWAAAEKAAAEALVASTSPASWTQVASRVTGPITWSTTVNSATAGAADVVGVCGADGTVNHYRGSVRFVDVAEGNRVVNRVPIESYLRGVIPKEVYASWGTAAGGKGMNALQAQAVAARSYALAQNRYPYAQTCDSSACQVYGGAATRPSATGDARAVEHPNTDTAISSTAGTVRKWPNGSIVSTEFSDSNGPRTAGGAFPPIDDPFDNVSGNRNHTWKRTLSAAQVRQAFSLGSAAEVATEVDPGSPYDGIWANRVRLTSGRTVSAWDFRNKFGLPSPGFRLKPVSPSTCMPTRFDTMAMIGDSVGVQVAGSASSPLRTKLDGKFAATSFDVLQNRATRGGGVEDGVTAAARVPVGTELVLVELGYNDDPGQLAGRIDAMMNALRNRSVGSVLWVNMSELRSEYAVANTALVDAQNRWSNLRVLDWRSASMARKGWFADGVHLTAGGTKAFAGYLTQEIARTAGVANGSCLRWRTARLSAGQTIEIPVLGRGGVPARLSQIEAISLNVTAVAAGGPGHLTVWECGTPQPGTSSVNYTGGSATPNAVVLPLAVTGKVCVRSHSAADVVVDISGWFDSNSGVNVATGRLFDSRRSVPIAAGTTTRVSVLGRFGVPASIGKVQGVSLNVTSALSRAPGHLTVWECGQPQPPTSSLNYLPDRTSANALVLPLSGSGEVCIRSHATTDVIVDISGWYDATADLHAASKRVYDTRRGPGRIGAGGTVAVPLAPGVGGTGTDVAGVVLNATAVNPSALGHVTVWRCGMRKPPVSTVNYEPNRNVPNMAILAASASASACFSTVAAIDLVVDVPAYFGPASGLHPSASRVIDTRTAVR